MAAPGSVPPSFWIPSSVPESKTPVKYTDPEWLDAFQSLVELYAKRAQIAIAIAIASKVLKKGDKTEEELSIALSEPATAKLAEMAEDKLQGLVDRVLPDKLAESVHYDRLSQMYRALKYLFNNRVDPYDALKYSLGAFETQGWNMIMAVCSRIEILLQQRKYSEAAIGLREVYGTYRGTDEGFDVGMHGIELYAAWNKEDSPLRKSLVIDDEDGKFFSEQITKIQVSYHSSLLSRPSFAG